MENDKLTQTWNNQKKDTALTHPDQIIKKAKKQRNEQFIGITVMSVTVLVLLIYTLYFASNWSNFTLGLVLMISSLTFRIVLEFISLYRKENQLVLLDNIAFQKYLKKHHKLRLKVNYIITPICFGIYIYGFTMLLPYFKQEFSESFYTYILISGWASFFVIGLIIINSIRKERHFLKQLNKA